MKMEHHRTRSIWSLLCNNQVELLPPGSQHNSPKYPQASSKIPKWKNANNKVNRWSWELTSYNLQFKWISGTKNKATDCLSHLVEHTPQLTTPVNMLTVIQKDGPAFHTRSKMKQDSAHPQLVTTTH